MRRYKLKYNRYMVLNYGISCHPLYKIWWRHQMETFSALLAICAGNSPVTGEFPAQRPVTRSIDVFFDLHLNKRLNNQSWGWWFETLSRPWWHHHNVKETVPVIWNFWLKVHRDISINDDCIGTCHQNIIMLFRVSGRIYVKISLEWCLNVSWATYHRLNQWQTNKINNKKKNQVQTRKPIGKYPLKWRPICPGLNLVSCRLLCCNHHYTREIWVKLSAHLIHTTSLQANPVAS